MSLLARILEAKSREVETMRSASDDGPCATQAPLPCFERLVRTGEFPLRLIAEIKFRSPSAGELSRSLSAAHRALAYARAGADMVSVLCDASFFGGGYARLSEARLALDAEGFDVPLLAKEFVVHERQIVEARSHGASAVLLIAKIVDAETLSKLTRSARALGLEPLVEVVTHEELACALDCGARAIGVNARDLDTLAMDPIRAAEVLAAIPGDRVALHFSGLASPESVRRVAEGRADGALIGEALMRQDEPSALLRSLVTAAAVPRAVRRSS